MTDINPTLANWLADNTGTTDFTLQPLTGGDINQVSLLKTNNNQHFCLKRSLQKSPPDFFQAEAQGLNTLAQTDALRTPNVFAVGIDYLLLEYIQPGKPGKDYWRQLGIGLAKQHRYTNENFGLEFDNYCGSTPQINTPTKNGYDFFAQHRLGFQIDLAARKNLITLATTKMLNTVVDALENIIPPHPASLLHGDLWSGNVFADEKGNPVLIDPACYFGWREADIAMTTLFGGFDPAFYQSYNEEYPMEAGWKQRLSVYNLYHLLNHVNLFGDSYTGQLQRTVDTVINSFQL